MPLLPTLKWTLSHDSVYPQPKAQDYTQRTKFHTLQSKPVSYHHVQHHMQACIHAYVHTYIYTQASMAENHMTLTR